MYKFLLFFVFIISTVKLVSAQENSPFSRYGIGDLTPNHNIVNRAMGGITAAYADNFNINLANPAALSNLGLTAFEIGGDIDIRNLKIANPVNKSTSVNTLISYVAIGMPLTTEKMRKKNQSWGLSFGLKPISRVSYKIEKNERITTIDSLITTYEGTGGLNQVFVSSGYRVGAFSFGLTGGYMFGSKNYSTKLEFVNDTIAYYRSNHATNANFNNVFLNAGIQYETILNKNEKNAYPQVLRIGAYGNLQQKLKATQDIIRETYALDASGNELQLDSVYEQKNVTGTITLPSKFGVGATFANRNWLVGADVEFSNWASYRYYNQADNLQNAFTVRAGAEYYPSKQGMSVKKYFSFVKYRAGFYYSKDYVKLNTDRNEFGFTTGATFPLTSLRHYTADERYGGLANLNLGLEVANRGNANTSIKENIIRFSVGVTMNARWFLKRKYD